MWDQGRGAGGHPQNSQTHLKTTGTQWGQLKEHSRTISLKYLHLLIPTPSGQDRPLRGVSGWRPEWRQGVLGRGHTWAVAPGLWGRGAGGGGAQVLATRDQPWTAQVLWAALPRLTRSLCVHLPATGVGILVERGGEAGRV